MSIIYKIFVGNVNFKTTEEQIREVFEPHISEIEDVIIARDEKTGRPCGYAFVLTHNHEEGRDAIKKIGKPMIENRRIYVKEAHGKRIKHKSRPRPNNKNRPNRRPRPHPQIHITPQELSRPPRAAKMPDGNQGGGYTGASDDQDT